MDEIYVHTLRYHYHGAESRPSRIMYPVSYGPFQDQESAWEWIRQRGITRATKLMGVPARDNIKIAPSRSLVKQEGRQSGFTEGLPTTGTAP